MWLRLAKKSERQPLTLSQLSDSARGALTSGADTFKKFYNGLTPEEQIMVMDLLKTAAFAALA